MLAKQNTLQPDMAAKALISHPVQVDRGQNQGPMTREGQVTGLAPGLVVSRLGAWCLLSDTLLQGCTFSGDLVTHSALTSPALPWRNQMNQPRPLPFQGTWPGSGRSRGAYYSYSVWQLQGRATACWGFSLGLSRVLSDLGLPPEQRSPYTAPEWWT